jgi:hypothetical protein
MLRREHFRRAELHLIRANREKLTLDRAQKERVEAFLEEDDISPRLDMIYEHHQDSMLFHQRQAEVHALLANCRIKDGDLGNEHEPEYTEDPEEGN